MSHTWYGKWCRIYRIYVLSNPQKEHLYGHCISDRTLHMQPFQMLWSNFSQFAGAPAVIVARDGFKHVNPEDVNHKAFASLTGPGIVPESKRWILYISSIHIDCIVWPTELNSVLLFSIWLPRRIRLKSLKKGVFATFAKSGYRANLKMEIVKTIFTLYIRPCQNSAIKLEERIPFANSSIS